MSIYVSEGGSSTFTPHPEGQYAARCIDVVDVGWTKTEWGPKYKVRLVFFCGEWTEKEIEGEKKKLPLLVFASFTATLNERGKLRPFLESWRGRVFTGTELGKFDVETVLGAPAFLQIVQRQNGTGRVFANVQTIVKLPPNMTAPEIPADFQRAKDREDWTGPAPHPERTSVDGRTDDPEPQDTHDYSDFDADMPF
jgi:hypothetical protein